MQSLRTRWRRRGVEGTVDLNGSREPATMLVGVLSLEFLVHAWDFAMATDREVVVSEPVSEYVLGIAGKVITLDARGYAGFDEPVAMDPDARVLDRLTAFTGRHPALSEVSR